LHTTFTRLVVATAVLCLTLALAPACSDGGEDGRLRVVATTTQIGDFASQVGGDRIALTVLLKPNQDAHDFEPSPSQLRALERADLVLRNGAGLDDFIDRALRASDATVVTVTDGVELRQVAGASGGGGADPHAWFSIANARIMLRNVRDAIVRADPANDVAYHEDASRYMATLIETDSAIRAQIATIPEACRKLVTNHDTFGYYADAYGLDVAGSVIPSISSQGRPSASDVAGIVRKIREQKVPAVFAETSLNPSLIRQVGREAGVKVVDDLYGDSLGPKGSDGDTYLKMMESNTRKIVDALKDCQT
jgi:zinc/manganese transport system substrate-binding protein/manganese/iron transport system substrate-binding protein